MFYPGLLKKNSEKVEYHFKTIVIDMLCSEEVYFSEIKNKVHAFSKRSHLKHMLQNFTKSHTENI